MSERRGLWGWLTKGEGIKQNTHTHTYVTHRHRQQYGDYQMERGERGGGGGQRGINGGGRRYFNFG